MTKNQKTWAAQHDWFLYETPNGVMVKDISVSLITGKVETKIEQITNFERLKTWAGY